ncbi:MAG: alkaline phosphatase PhoX, partial [Humibacillus sp.]
VDAGDGLPRAAPHEGVSQGERVRAGASGREQGWGWAGLGWAEQDVRVGVMFIRRPRRPSLLVFALGKAGEGGQDGCPFTAQTEDPVTHNPDLSRRTFVGLTAVGLGAAITTAPAGAAVGAVLPGEAASARRRPRGPGYGPLVPDPAGLLDLPAGFHYTVLAVAGNSGNPIPATVLADGGEPSPSRYDGTGSFPRRGGGWVLVSNHENGSRASAPVPHRSGITYDEGSPKGGTTSITVDKRGNRVAEVVSLAGTWSNCAGGVSPWGTWLSCEESEQKVNAALDVRKDHGYVFEVRPLDPTNALNARPIKAFGRFPHEAVVVDPLRGHVYSTEDASNPNGLLYRWSPDGQAPRGFGDLADDAGTLEAMYAADGGVFVPDLSVYSRLGATLEVRWVSVPDRDARTISTRKQFNHAAMPAAPGGDVTRSRKLEGMWWGDDGFYFDASFARSSDGSAGQHDGQIWFYDARRGTITLKSYYAYTPANQDAGVDGPDNLTVNPYGGLVLCEDGNGKNHLVLDDLEGGWAFLALNRQDSEMAGANFSANGQILFANSQDPGVVFAITGPWKAVRAESDDEHGGDDKSGKG